MSILVTGTPVSTFVEAGVRAVSAVAPMHRALPVDDQSGHSQASVDQPQPPRVAADRQALEDAAEALNQYFSLRRAELHFSVDSDTDRLVVKVIDARDGRLIRQIPDEQALRMAQALQSETPALFQHEA